MKYLTIIEIVSQADNENEAAELAGEFLRGNIESGVKMKCSTKPLKCHVITKSLTAVAYLVLVIGLASLGFFRDSASPKHSVNRHSAIQPPLKTNQTEAFKRDWEGRQSEKAFE